MQKEDYKDQELDPKQNQSKLKIRHHDFIMGKEVN